MVENVLLRVGIYNIIQTNRKPLLTSLIIINSIIDI